VLGDLAEEFVLRHRTLGAWSARRWYWRQALGSVAHAVRRLRPDRDSVLQDFKGVRMTSLMQDVRFGWRMARRRPLVTTVALISLVIGMSAATVVFGLLNAVLFRPLPVADPDRLALVLEQRESGMNHNFSYADLTELRAAQKGFVDLVAYSRADATLGQSQGAEIVAGELVSGSYFPTLGVRMLEGRGLIPADDDPGGPPVVVVSESLWRRLQGAGTSVRTAVLNRHTFEVVGVAAEPFRGMEVGRDVRFWAPLRSQKILSPSDGRDLLSRPTASWLTLIGRLRPETTFAKAQDELDRIEAGLPKTPTRARNRRFAVQPGRQGDSFLPQTTASPLTMLLAAAGLVLLVACANVAGLLLARATERERELALRTALGASRGRLIRLLLSEALLLGAGATLVSLVVASLVTKLAVPLMASFGETVTLDVSPDWRVFAFVAALGLAATAIFGLVPIVAALRQSLTPALADANRSASPGRRRALIRHGLVVAQFALSLSLVVVATLLGRTLYNLRTLPTGFDLEHLAVLEVAPQAAQYDRARMAAYLDAAGTRLSAVPGVRAVGFARVVPLDFGGSRTTIAISGYQAAPDEDMEINFNRVSAGYFEAMGLAPKDGRVFGATDVRGAPLSGVINETMARRYWPRTRAVGNQFSLGPDEPVTVVGVVPDVTYRNFRDDAGPTFYLAQSQSTPGPGAFHVRTAGPPAAILDVLRQALVEVDGNVPITRARTLREQADLNVNDDRLAMTIALGLAGSALLLAAVGLYGAMSYAVSQRTREIGVRMALGAVPGDVRRLVLRRGLALAIAGSLAGVGLGLFLARQIRHRLFGVEPTDPVTLVLAIVILSAIALLASWIPARSASRVNPVAALRSD
jgi:putative ABC transport system permease protein